MLVLFDGNGRYQGLCLPGVNCTEIPADAVEISEEDWRLYVQNGCNDYVCGTDGKPQKKPAYVPTTDELLAAIRAERNRLLTEYDWTQLPDAPLPTEKKQVWAEYRQTLRDLPETCDPQNPVWPVKPV